jgi:hypothetical protein
MKNNGTSAGRRKRKSASACFLIVPAENVKSCAIHLSVAVLGICRLLLP